MLAKFYNLVDKFYTFYSIHRLNTKSIHFSNITHDKLVASFYFLVGITLPLPVFYNFVTRKFIVVVSDPYAVFCVVAGAPVPIGFITLALLGLTIIFEYKISTIEKTKIFTMIGLIVILAAMVLLKVEFLRAMSVLFPLLFLFLVCFLCLAKHFYCFLWGYTYSFFVLILLHIFNICISSCCIKDVAIQHLYKSFFGYEIYQAFVTFSSVLSFFGVSILLFLLVNMNSRMKNVFLVVMILLTYFILALGYRRAVLYDLVGALLVLLWYGFRVNLYKVNRRFIPLTLLSVTLILFYFCFGLVKFGLNSRVLENCKHSIACERTTEETLTTAFPIPGTVRGSQIAKVEVKKPASVVASIAVKTGKTKTKIEKNICAVAEELVNSRWNTYYVCYAKIKQLSFVNLMFAYYNFVVFY